MRLLVIFALLAFFPSIAAAGACDDIRKLAQLSDSGDIVARLQLGVCYGEGKNVHKDKTKARELFEKIDALSLGSDAIEQERQAQAYARNLLGVMYFKGDGVIRNEGKAKILYEKAIEQKLPKAMTNLGYLLTHGRNFSDVEKAISLYERAAEAGDTDAYYLLGDVYDYGPRRDYYNKHKARECYEKAAEKGHLNAQYRLGMMYKDGVGARQDSAKAVQWLEKAMSRKHIDAYYALGMMYYDGEGIEKDLPKAKEMFGLGCDAGHDKCCAMYAKINKGK